MSRYEQYETLIVNADNGRDPVQIDREMQEAARLQYAIIGAIETIGSGTPPNLKGYRKFSDRSTDSRKNVTAWVRADLDAEIVGWIDHDKTFPRKEGKGPHPARSTMILRVGDALVLVGHAPPNWPGAGPAREEWVNDIADRVAPWRKDDWLDRDPVNRRRVKRRPVLILVDHNGLGRDLARAIGGRLTGSSVDALISRKVRIRFVRRVRNIGTVPFQGDHGHVTIVGIEVPAGTFNYPSMTWEAP